MAPATRRVLTAWVVALVLPAAALAGDPNDPTKRHTAADMRTAAQIALRKADFVAGWKRVKTDNSNNDVCTGEPNESKLVETADVDPTFESSNGAVDIDSEVQIFETARMAGIDWSYGTVPRLRTCAEDELTRQLGKGTTFTLTQVKAPTIGGVRTKSFHLVIHAKVNGRKVVVTSDLIALNRGRVTVMLTVIGPQGTYRRAQVAPFAAVLARRLLAHSA